MKISFTCPMCEIAQHDLGIQECRLFHHPENSWTVYRCQSCGSRLHEEFLAENDLLPE